MGVVPAYGAIRQYLRGRVFLPIDYDNPDTSEANKIHDYAVVDLENSLLDATPMLLPTYARAWGVGHKTPAGPFSRYRFTERFTALGRHPEGPHDVGLFNIAVHNPLIKSTLYRY